MIPSIPSSESAESDSSGLSTILWLSTTATSWSQPQLDMPPASEMDFENPSLAISRHESILWMHNDARLQSFICCFASCGLPKSTGAVACNALLGTSIDGMQAPPCAMVRVMQQLNCRLQNCQNCTQAFFNFFEDKPQLPFSSSCIWE